MTVDLTTFEKIAEGIDSHVYRDGDTVYKSYLRLSRSTAQRYADLVNRAVPVIAGCDLSPKIPIDDKCYGVRFRGIPVLDVTEDSDGHPVVLAPYIAYPNLDKLSQNPQQYRLFARSLSIGDSESAFLTSLNLRFYEELPTRTLDEFLYHADLLSRILDRELGVFGIYIGKYNAKIEIDLDAAQLTIVVTDLSVYIDRLSYDR